MQLFAARSRACAATCALAGRIEGRSSGWHRVRSWQNGFGWGAWAGWDAVAASVRVPWRLRRGALVYPGQVPLLGGASDVLLLEALRI